MQAAHNSTSHEEFIHAIRDIVVKYQPDAAIRERLLGVKLVYGIGAGHYRGICYFGAWQNGKTTDFLEIAATGEESPTQLAGTTIHELGHVIAGNGAGHGKDWKAACLSLGLTAIQAGGQHYEPEHFAPYIWSDIEKLAPSDGTPLFNTVGKGGFIGLRPAVLKPCPLGIGTRGGKSRGIGSGSRMRKFICGCLNPKTGLPIPVRRASDLFNATCHDCGKGFTRDDTEPRVNANEPVQAAADSRS
jgi:hypothetical protein